LLSEFDNMLENGIILRYKTGEIKVSKNYILSLKSSYAMYQKFCFAVSDGETCRGFTPLNSYCKKQYLIFGITDYGLVTCGYRDDDDIATSLFVLDSTSGINGRMGWTRSRYSYWNSIAEPKWEGESCAPFSVD